MVHEQLESCVDKKANSGKVGLRIKIQDVPSSELKYVKALSGHINPDNVFCCLFLLTAPQHLHLFEAKQWEPYILILRTKLYFMYLNKECTTNE